MNFTPELVLSHDSAHQQKFYYFALFSSSFASVYNAVKNFRSPGEVFLRRTLDGEA
jgi:hypothetical protein